MCGHSSLYVNDDFIEIGIGFTGIGDELIGAEIQLVSTIKIKHTIFFMFSLLP